jgi:hypothetical protein
MKKLLFGSALCLLLSSVSDAQVFSTVTTTGYNLDAVAENTTAVSTTGGAIDGSDYVMYSASYAAFYSGATGLPSSGTLASGTRTYQLQSYSGNNMLYVTAGQTDSLLVSNPASYGALSLLCFATEGTGAMNVTVRFTDNTTQSFSSISVPDWFATATSITSGFDRCNRTTGTPNYQTSQPKMFSADLVLNCANRQKSVSTIKVQNTGSNPRLCIMALSASQIPAFSSSIQPVTCSGGTNGSATITPAGGLGPYSFTVNSNPPQFNATPANLPTGAFSYTAQDAAGCPVTGSFVITQSLAAQPSLTATASSFTTCAGTQVTISVTGAATYTWSNSSNSSSFVATPVASTIYSVSGHTSANCLRAGTVQVHVNALPVVSITGLPPSICVNSATVSLNNTPAGGILSGPGTGSGGFDPSALQPGSYTLTYVYTDGNNCTASVTAVTIVNPVPAIGFTVTPASLCVNSSTIALVAQPPGGNFSGSGVSNAIFTPSVAGAGIASITYSYTDSNGCTSGATSTTNVHPLPVISFTMSKTTFCQNSTLLPLIASPSTGTFSGQGVSGSFFYPSQAGVGTHTIVYMYTDMNSCTAKTSATATVNNCTGIGEHETSLLSIWPNPNNGNFNVSTGREATITLYSVTGTAIIISSASAENNYTVNFTGLSAGIYILRSGNTCAKIVVSR